MTHKHFSIVALAFVAVAGVSFSALALDPPTATQAAEAPSAQPAPQGLTPEQMEACMAASKPGAMHEWLAKDVGHWKGNSKFWEGAGTEPTVGSMLLEVESEFDGRFIEYELVGDMAGAGSFRGMGTIGYDVAQGKFVGTWADNMGTGMMFATGTLSKDSTTLTMEYSYFCPLRKCQQTMRESTVRESDDRHTVSMWAKDLAGKEFKMMEVVWDRNPSAADDDDDDDDDETKSGVKK